MTSIPTKSNKVGMSSRRLILAFALLIVLAAPETCFALDLTPAPSPPASPDSESISPVQPPATPMSSKRVLNWETGEGQSYIIPAIEIPAFIAALNGYDRLVYRDVRENGRRVYESNFALWWDNAIHERWGFDADAFSTNQFAHPYAGNIYYGFARSAGLNYWESFAYTFMGSWIWETGGETTRPSVNDQVASGIAGTFFGEPLFRMASLTLEGGDSRPGFWRELVAALLSPPTGINRLVFGDRFKPVFPSHDPAYFWRLRLGAVINSRGSTNIVSNAMNADYSMSYGLPGKPGYDYTRPFDYFNFELNALVHAKNPIENILIRGLLTGNKYEWGESYRGVWGLYGTYDFISPHIFRVSSTAVNLGTTAQWWLDHKLSLQGTVLGGAGYAAGGEVPGPGQRNYHYGVSFQGLLSLRLAYADLALIEATGHDYYISGLGGTVPNGNDLIGRWNANVLFRIWGHHALGLQYVFTDRTANYSNRSTYQSAEAYSFMYTYLSDTNFGAVEWRGAANREAEQ